METVVEVMVWEKLTAVPSFALLQPLLEEKESPGSEP